MIISTLTCDHPYLHKHSKINVSTIFNCRHKIRSYLPVKVCSFLWRIFLLKSSRPSPGALDKSISVSCAVKKWSFQLHNLLRTQAWVTWKLFKDLRKSQLIVLKTYLVLRIIREGTGPKILSIMAKCSRLSWVWESDKKTKTKKKRD